MEIIFIFIGAWLSGFCITMGYSKNKRKRLLDDLLSKGKINKREYNEYL
jgi:polyhydroxyalkanoate synthesis regulator phasin